MGVILLLCLEPRNRAEGLLDVIGYFASSMLRLTPLPHGTSAKCKKKTVFDTVYFAVLVAIREQAHIATNITKATPTNGFLFALCSRDSGGIRTHDPQLRRLLLYPAELRNHPLAKRNKLCEAVFVTFCGAKVIKIYRTTKFFIDLNSNIARKWGS